MEIPKPYCRVNAVCLVLCLVQCVITSPVYHIRPDLLDNLRQRERRYSSYPQTLYPEDLKDPFGFRTGKCNGWIHCHK